METNNTQLWIVVTQDNTRAQEEARSHARALVSYPLHSLSIHKLSSTIVSLTASPECRAGQPYHLRTMQ